MNDDELRRILKDAYGDRQLNPEAGAHMLDRLPGTGVRGHRRMVSALAGAILFVAIAAPLGLVIGLGHHEGGASRHPAAQVSAAPSATPSPGESSSPPSTPPPTPPVSSTITAPAPLIVTHDPSQQLTAASPLLYIARNYQGQVMGTLTIDQAAAADGVLFSPDGSKFLIGGGIVFDVEGHQVADLYSAANASALVQPMWGDDSEHICGIASDGTGSGSLLEFSLSGAARTIAPLGPLTGSQGGWSVLACSPNADRAVVSQGGSQPEFLVIRLSSGQVVATYPGPASATGAGAASHDGSLVAADGPSGITILDTLTGKQLASVVRWGDVGASPFIGSALAFSWDGSRLLIQSDIAQGGPRWIVAWATNTDLVTNQTPGVDLVDVIPLTSGATMFIQNPVSPYDAYLLENDGTLQALPAVGGDGAAPS